MKCPVCNGTTRVASTVENSQKFTKRKLQCCSCKRYFYTIEQFESWTNDKSKKDFDIQAMFAGALAVMDQYKEEPAPEPKDNIF